MTSPSLISDKKNTIDDFNKPSSFCIVEPQNCKVKWKVIYLGRVYKYIFCVYMYIYIHIYIYTSK